MHVSSNRFAVQWQLAQFPAFEVSAIAGIDVRMWRECVGRKGAFDARTARDSWPPQWPSSMRLDDDEVCVSAWRNGAACWPHSRAPGLLELPWRSLGGSPLSRMTIPSVGQLISDSGKMEILDSLLTRYATSLVVFHR